MILMKVYNEEERTQKVWYDSSMIAYTEMVEDEFENKGNLHVTFKNGSTYIYKDVLLEDYVLFIGGGTDASQGKTLNKVIKSKYEFEKGENKDVQKLFELLDALKTITDNDISQTFFISGHRNITENEFEFNYIPKIINKVGGFKSDDERDEAMTKNSSFDIAFVRNNNIITGTGKNILRRNILINI